MIHKTIKSAIASVTPETRCTCCGKPASAGYVNAVAGEACVAMIHDQWRAPGMQSTILHKWKGRKRILGIPGAGLLDRR